MKLIEQNKLDVIFLSETKKNKDVLTNLFNVFNDYNVIINSHTPSHWHGVVMMIKKTHKYQEIPIAMNIPVRKDCKSAFLF